MSKSFADKILELRTQKNISQRELGEAIGVSNLSILNYEKGLKKPRRNTLIKIAEYFNMPIEYFNEDHYEPMKGLVSIVPAGGAASKKTLKYRVNLSNKWMQVMGISKEDKLVDLLYKDKTIIIQKSGGLYDASYKKTTGSIQVSTKYMAILLNEWMKDMGIKEDKDTDTEKGKERTVELTFDGKKIIITKKEN